MLFHTCEVKEKSKVTIINNEESDRLKRLVYRANMEMNFDPMLLQKKSAIVKHTNNFTLKIEKNMFHLYLIPVVIHNRTYHFVIDTGAQISGIMDQHKELIKTYKVDMEIGIKSATGTQKKLQSICLDKMFVGSLEILNHNMVVLNGMDFKLPIIHKNVVHFDGILGWDILSQIDFEIDDISNRFSMIENKEEFTHINLLEAKFPTVLCKGMDGHISMFGIDSGAEIGWLNSSYCKKRNLSFAKETNGMTMGVHGIEKTKMQTIKKCELYLYKSYINMENVRIGETKVFANLALDGILGNEIFKNRRIQFINSKGIVRIL